MHNIRADLQETLYDWSKGNVMFKGRSVQDLGVGGFGGLRRPFVFNCIVFLTHC